MATTRKIKCDCGQYLQEKETILDHIPAEAMVCPQCDFTTLTKEQVREFRIEHLKEYAMSPAAIGYQKGVLSLEEAATKAKVSIWQMLDYLSANNIIAPAESLAELEESLARTRKLLSAK